MVTTFEVLLRLLLMAAGGSVAGYLGWAYFGTFGYNLTVMANLEMCTLDGCAPCFTAIRAKDGWHA